MLLSTDYAAEGGQLAGVRLVWCETRACGVGDLD